MQSVAGKYVIENAMMFWRKSSVNPLRKIAHHSLHVVSRHCHDCKWSECDGLIHKDRLALDQKWGYVNLCPPHLQASLFALMVTMIKQELVSVKEIVTMPNVLLILDLF